MRLAGGLGPCSVSSSARFSTPGSNCASVIPSAFEIFARFWKLTFDSPLSIVPIKVRCTPQRSANASWEYPCFARSSRIRWPKAFSISCTIKSLEGCSFHVYSICIDTVCLVILDEQHATNRTPPELVKELRVSAHEPARMQCAEPERSGLDG